jgi:hypothetical protein
MPGVRWANRATQRAYEALIHQPSTIHIPCTPHTGETTEEFAARLCTLLGALTRAVEEFGLDGPICTWLTRVEDWRVVNWDQVSARLSRGTAETAQCNLVEQDHGTAIAAQGSVPRSSACLAIPLNVTLLIVELRHECAISTRGS